MAKPIKPLPALVSICIPTYNGDEYLEDLLKMVLKQKVPFEFEVLIIDSGSTDNTLSIIGSFPEVRLHQIPNSEFGHGKTRNLAASMAKGEYVVYLSQDATPATNRWLEYMLEPFLISDKVFCVYGRQIPRPFIDATTKREVSGVFNYLGADHSIVLQRKRSLITNKITKPYLTFFSDVNSAVRKDYLLNNIPYRDVRYAEDQLLGADILDNGYIKAYSPLGAVIHSNEYRLRDYFYRKFDENLGIYETLGTLPSPSRKHHIKQVIIETIKDFIFITRDKDFSLKRKLISYPDSFVRNILKQYAAYIISREKFRKKIGLKYSLEARKNSKND